MDFFRDAWIPTDIGEVSLIEALQSAHRIQWHRGDWTAATMMVLHAMVQTAVVLKGKCKTREDWEELFYHKPDDLSSWFDGLDPGTHPWQCLTATKTVPVSALLPESPGANALVKCSDIAVWKEAAIKSLTKKEALIALISTQFWGLSSGSGHQSGCRGQTPLTIMVEPSELDASLWDKIWLNVLPSDVWAATTNSNSALKFEFPWLKPRIGTKSTPANTHALEMLWQMPRRWRIIESTDGLVREMVLEGKGIAYADWTNHPLTAYREKKVEDKKAKTVEVSINSVKTTSVMGFQEWAVLQVGLDKNLRSPVAVHDYIENPRNIFDGQYRLRCFGWAIDGKAIAGWSESVVPLCVKASHKPIEEALLILQQAQDGLRECLGTIKSSLGMEAKRLSASVEAEFYARVTHNDWATWEPTLKKLVRTIFWDVMESNSVGYAKVFSVVTPANKRKFLRVM